MRDYFHNKTPFQVVIYLRPQHQWLESLYNERAKNWKSSEAIDSTEFAERTTNAPYFHWTRLINDIKEEVGPDRLIVRPYVPGTNATVDFLTTLGLPTPERLQKQRPRNPSQTPQQIALLQRLVEALGRVGELELAAWVKETTFHAEPPKTSTRYSFFTEDTQVRLTEIAAADWRNLAAAVADTHLAVPHLFQTIAEETAQTQVKPFLGPLNDISFHDDAIRLLVEVLPYVRTHPKTLVQRATNFATRQHARARQDPRDLLAAIMRRLKAPNR